MESDEELESFGSENLGVSANDFGCRWRERERALVMSVQEKDGVLSSMLCPVAWSCYRVCSSNRIARGG